jgi:hypothetical protein
MKATASHGSATSEERRDQPRARGRAPNEVSSPYGAIAETILDRQMPFWDATRIERRVIDAPLEVVYHAALRANFLDAVRDSVPVRTLFALRAAAERMMVALRLARPVVQPKAAALRIMDMPLRGQWVILGCDTPNEITFGAIGRFWAGETRWLEIDATEFATFLRPGFARIGCNFQLRALGGARTLITYEARSKATDAAARRDLLRYWRFVSPFVGVVMRSMLATIDRATTRATTRNRRSLAKDLRLTGTDATH